MQGFNEAYLPVDYKNIKEVELDSSNGKYNQLLSPSEVLHHEGWRAAVDDIDLLKEYTGIVFKLKPRDERMGFWIKQDTPQDALRALYAFSIGGNPIGSNNLDNGVRFIQVTQMR